MSRRVSDIKKGTYDSLLTEFKKRDVNRLLNTALKINGIQLFSLYLTNYTSVSNVEEIEDQIIRNFLKHLLENQERYGVSVKDIKTIITVILKLTNTESYSFDFSISNLSLWLSL